MKVIYSFSAEMSGLSVLGTVEWGSRRFELRVGLVGFPQNFLGFITGQTFLSCELEGLETRMGGACLHLFITDS